MSNRRKFIQQIASVSALSLVNPTKLLANTETEHLCIMHTNDVHSHIEPFPLDHKKYPGMGGVARRAELINKIRSEVSHTLLLDAGDMFQGTPYFNYYGGELEFKLMNAMKYDAATIGNHDFDNGVDGLAKQAKIADFKLLSANYNFENTPMKGLSKPYQIFNKGKFRIGVFGLGIELKGLVDPKMYGKTGYISPINIAKELSDYLRNIKGCNLIICLSHLGLKYNTNQVSDMVLAKQCSEIDIILGGHTHTFLEKPIEIRSNIDKSIYICQVGWAGLMLGRIDVKLESKTNTLVVKSQSENI
jgi:5'-nucleotidase